LTGGRNEPPRQYLHRPGHSHPRRQANPIRLFALPASLVLWLPCWLFADWGKIKNDWRIAPVNYFRRLLGDWPDDLALMAEAARLLLCGRWVFWGDGVRK
jgi:hypothetical protein